MKTTLLLLTALSGILHAQGPLTPPAGPAPTMKSLDQIEPRTPISSLPCVISKSGSYYFTGNLVFTEDEGDAITITVSNVTVDLMGFTLSSKASVTGSGIVSGSDTLGITVRNGVIKGNTIVTFNDSPLTWTIAAGGFEYGIRNDSTHASFKDLSLNGARSSGLGSFAHATVDNVRSRNNGRSGILALHGTVNNSTASKNGKSGIFAPLGTVSNSTVRANGDYGISAERGSVTNSTAHSNGSVGIAALQGSVSNSTANYNVGDGISAVNGSVSNSTANHNVGAGIWADNGSVINSTVTGNDGNGISANYGTVTNSTARQNDGSGISAFSGSITSSTATDNGSDGIYASTGSVTSCTASSNTNYDISASNAVVAFSRFTTFLMNGSSRTGNFPSP